MISQTIQNPLEGVNEVNALGNGRKSCLKYVPYSTQKNKEMASKPKKSTFQIRERNDKKDMNAYLGTKRAFLNSHERSAKAAQKVLDKNWEHQEKIRNRNFKIQNRAIESNIRIRDPITLGDYRHKKLKIYGAVNQTTGPRPCAKLPPDRQVTEFPSTHIHYWG